MFNFKIIFIGCLLLLLARLSFFTEPFGISVDESTYMTFGEVVKSGGTLYVDAIDRKPPGLIWIFALSGSLFGWTNIHVIHVLIFVLTLSLAIAAARFSGSIWSFWLYILFSSALLRGVLAANAEYWMLLFLAPACHLCIQAFLHQTSLSHRALQLSFATFLAAISCLMKQYGGFIYACVYLSAWTYFCFTHSNRHEKWSLSLWSSLGSFLSLVIVFGSVYFYFASKNAASDFLYYAGLETMGYMSQDSSQLNQQTKTWWILLSIFGSWLPLWTLFLMKLPRSLKDAWLFLWMIGAFAALSTAFFSGRHYTHYFVPAIWFLCVALGPFAQEQLSRLGTLKRWLMLSFLALPFCVYLPLNLFQEAFHKGWTFTKARQDQMRELSDWIQENSSPTDRISVWGMASQIYVMSQRGSATAYIFADYVSGRLPGFRSSVSIPEPGAMEKYLVQLEKNSPLFWIDTSSAQLNDYGAFPPEDYPALWSFLNSRYTQLEPIAGFSIWRRKIGS